MMTVKEELCERKSNDDDDVRASECSDAKREIFVFYTSIKSQSVAKKTGNVVQKQQDPNKRKLLSKPELELFLS